MQLVHINKTESEFLDLVKESQKAVCPYCDGWILGFENQVQAQQLIEILNDEGDKVVCNGGWKWQAFDFKH